jgi:hypothetical protein
VTERHDRETKRERETEREKETERQLKPESSGHAADRLVVQD